MLANIECKNGLLNWLIPAKLDRSYQVQCVEPLLEPANKALLDAGELCEQRLVVIDSGIPALLCDQIKSYFSTHRVTATYLTVSGGEACKNFQALQGILEAFAAFRLKRKMEPVIVFGGGAVLDIVGFAASIYRRGVPFIRIPTTLLAFVDAAIGIKTGMNFGRQKNLLGSYYPPLTVFLDRNFLIPLNRRQFISGLAEILKVAISCDTELFEMLERNVIKFKTQDLFDAHLGEILFKAIDITLSQLAQNIYENDLYRFLDFGHTFSTAFEMTAASMPHGEAVALDMNLSAILSMHRGFLQREDFYRIARVTEQLGLPTAIPDISFSDIWNSVDDRSYHRGGHQRIPIPARLGQCVFIEDDLTPQELTDALKEFGRKSWR
ncbi:MAG: 2-epi-5-epi-valiolone synthase [Verrucomicrobia bacterium]|nr:MAG: 2-epi-5-epi-valiolone synthase [Verrucomicrobiota bacterium]